MIESSDLRMMRISLEHEAGQMPALGFGTLIPDPAVTITATRDALAAGFRHFDCAERYGNEREVGSALQAGLAAGGIAREDIFVTTKLWNTNHRPERVEPAFEASLDRLGLKYLDLYLIHTPFAFQPGDEPAPRDKDGNVLYDQGVTLLDTWKAMEGLVDRGKCRAIGLSDISLNELLPLYESASIKPAVVQLSPRALERPQHRCCWLGRCSAARLCLPHPRVRRARERISTSPLFRNTRSMKSIEFRPDRG
jgi:alcohol dehydrogenase (NADP+)